MLVLAEHVEVGVSPGAGAGTWWPEMGEGGWGVAAPARAPQVGDEQLVWVAWKARLPGGSCPPVLLPAPRAGGRWAWRDRAWTARQQPGWRWGVSWHILKVPGKEKELSL